MHLNFSLSAPSANAWIKASLSGLWLMAALQGISAHADPISDLSTGPYSGRIEFSSVTPPDRHLYARKLYSTFKDVIVTADILMPKNIAPGTKVPAVIVSHGSGGVESNSFDVWGRVLNEAGYAVMVTDTFTPRGVKETNSDQGRVPYPAHVADTMNALRVLSTHPQIDTKRIFNIGFSRGGSTAFDTAWPTWSDPINTDGVKFAGHVAMYPGNCNIRYRTDDREKVNAPVLVLLADPELEEAADVKVCERWYDELIAKGNDIKYKEYRGGRHAFDTLNFSYRWNPQTTSAKQCDMELYMTMKPGSGLGNNVLNVKANQPLTRDTWVPVMKDCTKITGGSRGGGNAEVVQKQVVIDTMSFLDSLSRR